MKNEKILTKSELFELRKIAAWQLFSFAGSPVHEVLAADGLVVWAAKRFPEHFGVLVEQIVEAKLESIK